MAHTNLWSSKNNALSYLSKADKNPHGTEGEKVLLELVPKTARNILDTGTGDEGLLSLQKKDKPEVEIVAVDFSTTMLEAGINNGGVFCNLA